MTSYFMYNFSCVKYSHVWIKIFDLYGHRGRRSCSLSCHVRKVLGDKGDGQSHYKRLLFLKHIRSETRDWLLKRYSPK